MEGWMVKWSGKWLNGGVVVRWRGRWLNGRVDV